MKLDHDAAGGSLSSRLSGHITAVAMRSRGEVRLVAVFQPLIRGAAVLMPNHRGEAS